MLRRVTSDLLTQRPPPDARAARTIGVNRSVVRIVESKLRFHAPDSVCAGGHRSRPNRNHCTWSLHPTGLSCVILQSVKNRATTALIYVWLNCWEIGASVFWRVLSTIGAVMFFVGGVDIATTDGCTAVDFGGTARRATYSCTYGLTKGDLSAGTASVLMILGSLALLALLWGPMIARARRGF